MLVQSKTAPSDGYQRASRSASAANSVSPGCLGRSGGALLDADECIGRMSEAAGGGGARLQRWRWIRPGIGAGHLHQPLPLAVYPEGIEKQVGCSARGRDLINLDSSKRRTGDRG